jgi:NAD(P)-dependent dehydrogenase (short-subunit alcohol dehydrogenase family)
MSRAKPGTMIVTGGGRGIGAEVVQLCAQAGHNVLFTYASKPHRAQEVMDRCAPFGVKVVAVQADVRDPMLATAVVEQAQKLSAVIGLVNNAGITSRIGSFLDVDIETMRDVLEVNVLGTMVMCPVRRT